MIERRTITGEVRRIGENGNIIEGHGAVFEQQSLDIGFIEVLQRGAFDKTDFTDVRMLNDHISHMILARTKSGTLSVSIDETGLFYRGDVADTSYGKDLLISVGRRDVDQSSYGFSLAPKGDEWEYRDGQVYRYLHDIRSVVDVSPTAFPAYPQTHIDKRKVEEIRTLLNKPVKGIEYLDTMILVHKILYNT